MTASPRMAAAVVFAVVGAFLGFHQGGGVDWVLSFGLPPVRGGLGRFAPVLALLFAGAGGALGWAVAERSRLRALATGGYGVLAWAQLLITTDDPGVALLGAVTLVVAAASATSGLRAAAGDEEAGLRAAVWGGAIAVLMLGSVLPWVVAALQHGPHAVFLRRITRDGLDGATAVARFEAPEGTWGESRVSLTTVDGWSWHCASGDPYSMASCTPLARKGSPDMSAPR